MVRALADVKQRLSSLRGSLMPSYFAWSYKRSYKQGYVWHDVESDNDPIFPLCDGSEYVLIGCKIEPSCFNVQSHASTSKMLYDAMVSANDEPTLMLPSTAQVAELSSGTRVTMAGSSSKHASLHVGSDRNIMVKLGITEGLEHLHLNSEFGQDYEAYFESQASTSVDHGNAMEQRNPFFCQLDDKDERISWQPSAKEDALKAQIIPHCGSASLCKFSLYGPVADVATQTGEDDEPPTPNKKNEAMELSKEETSPPPCSTSSSTNLSSAHSASSSSSVLVGLGLPRLSLDQLMGLAEDEILEENDSVLSAASEHDSNYSVHFAKPGSKAINNSALGACIDHEEPNCGTMLFSPQNSKPGSLDSSSMKAPYAMRICGSSGRFVHLVSCNGGLDVINPIRKRSSTSQKEHTICYKVASPSTELLLRNPKTNAACIHISQLVNLRGETVKNNVREQGTYPTYVTKGALCGRIGLSQADGACDTTANLFPEGTCSTKKLWHLKGWIDSHCKKITASK